VECVGVCDDWSDMHCLNAPARSERAGVDIVSGEDRDRDRVPIDKIGQELRYVVSTG
jgi:hypothetical protein